MNELNLQLKRLRKEKGLNQTQMAELLGIKVARYRTWEYGTAMMSLEQAYNVTELLGCTLEELVGRKPPELRAVDEGQKRLDRCYQDMTDEGRRALLASARGLAETYEVKNNQDTGEQVQGSLSA